MSFTFKRLSTIIFLVVLLIVSVIPAFAKQGGVFVEQSIAWVDEEVVRAQFELGKTYDRAELYVAQSDQVDQVEYKEENQLSISISNALAEQPITIQLRAFESNKLVETAMYQVNAPQNNEKSGLKVKKERWMKNVSPKEQIDFEQVISEHVPTQSSLDKQEKSFIRKLGNTNKEEMSDKNLEIKGNTPSFEVEPNDEWKKADWLYAGKEAYGRIGKSGDIDYWKVKAPANGTINFVLSQIPNGQDYSLFLYDSEQKELGRSARAGGMDEAVENVGVEKHEWYFIEVRGKRNGFDKKNYYKLTATYQTAPGTTKPDQYEPNNRINDAAALEVGQQIEGTIDAIEDVDYYKFDITLASTLDLSLKGLPEGMDLDIYLLNQDQKVFSKSEYPKNRDELITYNGDPGTYYVKVVSNKRSAITEHQYKLLAEVHTLPVILIPGISGSRLNVEEDGKVSEAWLDAAGIILDNMIPIHRRVLPLQPQSPGSEKVVSKESGIRIFPEEGDFGFKATEFLSYSFAKKSTEQYYSISEHLQRMGYEKGKTLFALPYDWRLSNSVNTGQLKKLIDNALKSSKAKQVQLVAHSMGGLLAKDTLLCYPSYQMKTKRLIYMGTPFLGSPTAYQAIKFGYNYGSPVVNPETVRQISEYSPASYELLPSKEYVKKQSYLNMIADGNSRPFRYDEIINDDRIRLSYKPLVRLAEKQHSKWDSKSLNIPQYSIIGQGNITLLGYDYNNLFQRFTPYFDQANGDGTVPFNSANFARQDIRKQYYVNEEHAALVRNPHVIQQVANLLLGIEEVQQGLKASPYKNNPYNYYIIYTQNGQMPHATIKIGSRTISLGNRDEVHSSDVRIEYHGNVVVLYAPNYLSMRISNAKAETNNAVSNPTVSNPTVSNLIVQHFSSDLQAAAKVNGRRYVLNDNEALQIQN